MNYGITANIDLNGDGVNDLIVKSFIDNVSAHTVDVYTFHIMGQSSASDFTPNLIQLRLGKNYHYYFAVSHGADCDLSGLRLIKDSTLDEHGLQSVIGERKPGYAYTIPQKVTFTFYKLVYDEVSNQYAYEKYKTVTTKKAYCDINQAFKDELNL